VVVAYHAAAELERCLSALGDETQVTLVDNSSSAEVQSVASLHGATYLDPGSNLGFGRGANLALRQIAVGPPRDVLLLNPDARLAPRDTKILAEFLHRPGSERIAALSPRLVGSDGDHQRVEWPFPTPQGAWAEAVGLGRRLQGGRTFVIGAVMLLRWEALLEVGLFDERFFLYAEETDWQRRALVLGWTSAVCTEASARHEGAGTSQDLRRRETLFHAGQETYVRKWHGRAGWAAYRSGSCIGAAGRAVLLTGERRSAAARRARLYLRGPRRCAQPLRD
jgi:GT2 family glycosyltransferase